MAIFFSADHHFGHFNVIRYTGRPYGNTYHMDTNMVEKWNSVVSPKDTIYYLGDFSFTPQLYRDKVNGRIILIKGNHDKKKYFDLFDEVHDYLTLRIGDYNCFLSHQPIGVGDQKYWRVDYTKQAKGHDVVLCGHVHQNWTTNGVNVNVGVDVWDFIPIAEKNLIDFLDWLKGNKGKK